VSGYDLDGLWEELAYLAYHFHWPLREVLDLEHGDRRLLVQQAAALNRRAWKEVG
jgi:hypothetical protein